MLTSLSFFREPVIALEFEKLGLIIQMARYDRRPGDLYQGDCDESDEDGLEDV